MILVDKYAVLKCIKNSEYPISGKQIAKQLHLKETTVLFCTSSLLSTSDIHIFPTQF